MTDRNTREAPELDRCTTCGATRLDGNGNIKPLHGHLTCKRCRNGAQQLVRRNPEEWRFGADGRLEHIGPEDPSVTAAKEEVKRLTAAMEDVFEKMPVTIDVFHEQSGCAIVMPNGYRWHVYTTRQDPTGQGRHTVRLFSPDRNFVQPPINLLLSNDAHEASDQMLQLVMWSREKDSPLAGLIEDDALARVEIALFNPDDLLKSTPNG